MITDCPPPAAPPAEDTYAGEEPTTGPSARLISRPNDPQTYINHREVDARTAIKRGLKEYLQQLSIDLVGGRRAVFQKVFDVWAEPEDNIDFPSAIVYSTSEGNYDSSSLVPTAQSALQVVGNTLLVKTSEFLIDLKVEVWCTDPEQRLGIVTMLEDALNPLDWMYGFSLELPFYFNQRSKYELIGNTYLDTETDGFRRDRIATMTVRSSVPVIRPHVKRTVRPRLELTVE